jgi:tetratricopeptide (TPR) repeat protein
MPLNDNIVLSLAYEVLHGTLSSDEALLQLAKPDALNGLDESTIQFNDEIADAAWRELQDLAYALATINLAAARKLGRQKLQGRCALRLGVFAGRRNRLDEAMPLLEEAADLCRNGGDREGEIIALGDLGNVFFAQHHFDQAIDCYRRVLNLVRIARLPAMVRIGELNLANAMRAHGYLDRALEHYERALQLAIFGADSDLENESWNKLREAYRERAARYRQARQEEKAAADLRQAADITRALETAEGRQQVIRAYFARHFIPINPQTFASWFATVSIGEVWERIACARQMDTANLSIDEVETEIHKVMKYYFTELAWIIPQSLYRARKNKPGEIFTHVNEMWYPPPGACTRLGRLNESGQSLFYCSTSGGVAVMELRPGFGDVITLMTARPRVASERMYCAFLGLETSADPATQAAVEEYAARLKKLLLEHHDKWLLVNEFLRDLFTSVVKEGEEHRYKPSIAIARALFAISYVDGIIYPSVRPASRVATNQDINICLTPGRADELIEPVEFSMIRIMEERASYIRKSTKIDADGAIIWGPQIGE